MKAKPRKRAKNEKYDFVTADDWQGLYINGKLVLEDHSLHFGQVLESIGIDYDSQVIDEEWMEENGRLPRELKNVKLEK